MRTVWIVLAIAALAAGCGSGAGPARRPTAVASFYPLAEAAERIGGDRFAVENLTPPGAEPHDLELTTGQLDTVIDADVVLYLGGGFQPAVEDAVARATGRTLDVHAGGRDPHLWLDPRAWARAVERIGRTFAAADPDGAAGYRARAARYADELRALDSELARGLEDCERDLVVSSHDSFSYLARRYGLRHASIAGLSPEGEPDPGRLAEVVRLAEREGVTTVFTETLLPPDVAETVAREAGVEVAVLDPVEGLSAEASERGATYVSVMRDNLRALRAGLGCR